MTTADILKIVTGIIVSLGGGGAIILGLSNYFGQFLAKRYEEKVKAKFQNDINAFQSELDIIKQTTIRYSDKQFEHYSKLWSSLYDLKILADELWREANALRLENFSRQLKVTHTQIEKASLFIEDNHYKELTELIKYFSDYNLGKSNLITYRSDQNFDDYNVRNLIAQNGAMKTKYEELILMIKADLKRQLK